MRRAYLIRAVEGWKMTGYPHMKDATPMETDADFLNVT